MMYQLLYFSRVLDIVSCIADGTVEFNSAVAPPAVIVSTVTKTP